MVQDLTVSNRLYQVISYFFFSFVIGKNILYLGDNCIQNFHLGRYIIGYTVRNLVLKRDFRTFIG